MRARAPLLPLALAWLVLAACAGLPASAAGAPLQTVQVTSSAQLVLDAEARPGELLLRITRTGDHRPVTGAGNVTVRIGGRAAKVSARHGDYVVSTDGLHGGKQPIEVVVAHDGIRELLTGSVTLPKASTMLERIQKHSGWAWWVLNIAVLLLAFRMISHRKKKAP